MIFLSFEIVLSKYFPSIVKIYIFTDNKTKDTDVYCKCTLHYNFCVID